MIRRYAVLMLMVFSCCAAGISAKGKKEKHPVRMKVVSWNIQTFFDAHRDGTEYPEFRKPRSGWNRGAYADRVAKLCNAVAALDGDIVVLQEVENSGILYDLYNGLAKDSWFRKKTYRYACFASEPHSALGCAVLSRYPLSNVTVHTLDVRLVTVPRPDMRPILSVTVSAGGKKCAIFVNHWKSKAGKGDAGGIWRQYQEAVLAQCIAAALDAGSEYTAVLACGDFNKDITEFSRTGPDSPWIQLNQSMTGGRETVEVYSPWLDSGICCSPGSFYFHEQWERIDHFFAAGNIRIIAFKADTDGPWADHDGKPIAYQLYRKKGYSDHLPVSCIMELPDTVAE